MSEQRHERPSTFGLVSEALSQVAELFGAEVRLARTEISAKISTAILAIVSIVGAAVFLIVALIFLLQALVAWLVELGWRPSLASLVVGLAIATIAVAAIFAARSRLAIWRLAPTRTIDQAKKVANAVRGRD